MYNGCDVRRDVTTDAWNYVIVVYTGEENNIGVDNYTLLRIGRDLETRLAIYVVYFVSF